MKKEKRKKKKNATKSKNPMWKGKKKKRREPKPRNPMKRYGKKRKKNATKPKNPMWKGKKKMQPNLETNVKRKEKKKKKRIENDDRPRPSVKEKKKTCLREQKVYGSHVYVFIYHNAMETQFWLLENTSNVFLVFMTHHSKIKELSDENLKLKTHPNKLLSRGTHQFWVMEDGNRVMGNGKLQIQTAPKSLVVIYGNFRYLTTQKVMCITFHMMWHKVFKS